MNHLAHFLLCPPDDQMRAGTLIADHVRGTDLSMFPTKVEQGIRLHRRIDALVDTSPEIIGLKALVGAPLRRYAGILFDVFFDYALIRQWPAHSDVPIESFKKGVYASLQVSELLMPPNVSEIARRMRQYDALGSCATPEGCAHTLRRIAARLKRPVALEDGIDVLLQHETLILDGCAAVIPMLRTGCAAHLQVQA